MERPANSQTLIREGGISTTRPSTTAATGFPARLWSRSASRTARLAARTSARGSKRNSPVRRRVAFLLAALEDVFLMFLTESFPWPAPCDLDRTANVPPCDRFRCIDRGIVQHQPRIRNRPIDIEEITEAACVASAYDVFRHIVPARASPARRPSAPRGRHRRAIDRSGEIRNHRLACVRSTEQDCGWTKWTREQSRISSQRVRSFAVT